MQSEHALSDYFLFLTDYKTLRFNHGVNCELYIIYEIYETNKQTLFCIKFVCRKPAHNNQEHVLLNYP